MSRNTCRRFCFAFGRKGKIYDSASNLISEKNAIGAVKTYTYDEFGNVNTAEGRNYCSGGNIGNQMEYLKNRN